MKEFSNDYRYKQEIEYICFDLKRLFTKLIKKECTPLLLLNEWEFWRIKKEIGSMDMQEII